MPATEDTGGEGYSYQNRVTLLLEGYEGRHLVFVGTCRHCVATAPGTTISSPLGPALHAAEHNKLHHFDFCFISRGIKYNKYVLVLKGDLSGHVWLKATTATSTEVTADQLIEWFASFGHVRDWESDQGTHFKNEVVEQLSEFQMRAPFHIGVLPMVERKG